MKYIAKMMLALLASVTLVIPAYAWDFGASGSMNTTFNITTVKLNESVDALESKGVGSDAGEIALSSSHTEGDSTVSIKYGLDWDGNLDEVWTASGSTKVGKWTASASIDYNNDEGAQTAKDEPSLTLTDGTLTITMGKAGHLASASKGAGDSVADGEVQWMALDDYDIGAATDSFQGVSVGYKLNDTSSVTFVVQAGSTGVLGVGDGLAASSNIGAAGDNTVTTENIVDAYNAAKSATLSNCSNIAYTGTTAGGNLKITTTDKRALACYATWKESEAGKLAIDNATEIGSAAVTGHSVGSEGFGLSYSGVFGAASVDFSYLSSTAKSNASAVTDKIYGNTMSLAVGMDLGTLSPYLTYATYEMGQDGSNGKFGLGETGMRIGTTMAMGEDTVGVEMTTVTAKGTGTASSASKAVSETGIEVGYATSVGPATLSVGYGTYSIAVGDMTGPYRNFYAAAPAADYGKGGTKTDMEVKLEYSF